MLKMNQKKKKQVNTERLIDNNIFKNGTTDTIDLVMPDVFVEDKDYIYMGPEKYCRVYNIETFPRSMNIGELNELFDLGSIDISNYVENIPDGEVIGRLTDKYSKIQSNINLKTNRGVVIDYAEQLAANDLDSLREVIQTNKERMFYVQTLIKVWGKSLQDLNDRCELMEDICARKGIKPRAAALKQKEAFLTSLPYLNIKMVSKLRNMTTGALACLVPTGNTELLHETGIYLGENLFTHSKIILDTFIGPPELTNPHMFVVGIAGAGKSVGLKTIVGHGAAKGEWEIILDPEEEYKKLVANLGGQYIILKPGEKSGINPLDLEEEDDGKGGRQVDIYGKLSEIRELLSTFCEKFRGEGLKGKEITTVEEAVKTLYSEKEITQNPESLYEENSENKDGKFYVGKVKKVMPTLSDLKKLLEQYEWTKELAEMMKIITGDGSLAMFDCQTTVNLNKRVIGFDLKHLSDEFTKFYATVNILSWIWSKFGNYKYRDNQKRVVVDEGWLFAKYQHSAAFLETIARRGRKYKISLVIASQMINEFLSSESGQAVIHQCATKIIMQQDPSIAKDVAQFFRLSSKCDEMLSTFTSGQALLLTEHQLVVMQIKPFDFEWEYIQT